MQALKEWSSNTKIQAEYVLRLACCQQMTRHAELVFIGVHCGASMDDYSSSSRTTLQNTLQQVQILSGRGGKISTTGDIHGNIKMYNSSLLSYLKILTVVYVALYVQGHCLCTLHIWQGRFLQQAISACYTYCNL